VIKTLTDYYRPADSALGSLSLVAETASGNPGYFQFGDGNVCYGRSRSGTSPTRAQASNFDALQHVRQQGAELLFPFDFADIIENLRLEHYRERGSGGFERFATSQLVRKSYYLIRRALPFPVRRRLQKIYFRDWKEIAFPAWPVDFTVDNLHRQMLRIVLEASGEKRLPFVWFWPDGAPSALIMTHDVETASGRDFTSRLMDLDDAYGIKASYQVIPEKRYTISDEYVSEIRNRGCEFNIHDLNHDGNLYQERAEFERRAAGINSYVRRYHAQGFRAGAMYRRQDWYDAFEFSYDMSVPNVAHLEPLRGGCCTVMPYFMGKVVELPLTTTQDYSLFHILNDYSTRLWQTELALIRENHGLMSLLTHPDYLVEARARKVYEELLEELREMIVSEGIWCALPRDVDHWWRVRGEMKLVRQGEGWEIVGPEHERARVAYAVLEDNRLVYVVPGASSRDLPPDDRHLSAGEVATKLSRIG
jgi:hypothetical protein